MIKYLSLLDFPSEKCVRTEAELCVFTVGKMRLEVFDWKIPVVDRTSGFAVCEHSFLGLMHVVSVVVALRRV